MSSHPTTNTNPANAYTVSSASNQPKPRMLYGTCEDGTQQRNVENVQRQAPASGLAQTAQASIVTREFVCKLCQSSPFETLANKEARYAVYELPLHIYRHHDDRTTFDTWLLFHFNTTKYPKCPICHVIKTWAIEMCLHLLEQHHTHVPAKLPAKIFCLAYRLCLYPPSGHHYYKKAALKYRDMVERLEGRVEPVNKRKAPAELPGGEKNGAESGDQANKKCKET